MTDVTISGSALGLLASVGGTLVATITLLFRLLLGRLDRAERQVDTSMVELAKLVASTQRMSEQMADILEHCKAENRSRVRRD